VPTLEGKIVQGAVAGILGAVPRVPARAQPARIGRWQLHTALMSRQTNCVLDADIRIRNFFDSVHDVWMMRMVVYRIADARILDLIWMWRVDAGRGVHREAQNAEKMHCPQVERAPP
jgi:hypothetical protein